jgi:four helix bundle protein
MFERVYNLQKIFTTTKYFPSDEKYGLSSQIKRAVVFCSCNIAEGAARKGDKEFINFYTLLWAQYLK